jgi:hypothetical protein
MEFALLDSAGVVVGYVTQSHMHPDYPRVDDLPERPVVRRHRFDAETGEFVPFTPPPAHTDYVSQRCDAMPSIPDQLDALWHAMDAGVLPVVPAFYNPIKAVKQKYPKS